MFGNTYPEDKMSLKKLRRMLYDTLRDKGMTKAEIIEDGYLEYDRATTIYMLQYWNVSVA